MSFVLKNSLKNLILTCRFCHLPFQMFLCFSLFRFVSSAKKSDYLFWGCESGNGIDYNQKTKCMFNNQVFVKPGLKIAYNKPTGGVSSKTIRTFNSERDASIFLSLALTNDEYARAQKKLKNPKFRTQLCTMRTYEVYSGKQYLGRNFEIKTTFLSVVKNGTKYRVTIAPFTTSIIARTFLYSIAHWTYISEEKEFDQKRATDRKYVNEVYNYVNKMKKVINAPYPILIGSNIVEKIYSMLYSSIEYERQKFVALPY